MIESLNKSTQPILLKEKELELSPENKDTLKDIGKMINKLPGNKLEFGFNDENGMATISVFEIDSHKLIRKFPSKEFLVG